MDSPFTPRYVSQGHSQALTDALLVSLDLPPTPTPSLKAVILHASIGSYAIWQCSVFKELLVVCDHFEEEMIARDGLAPVVHGGQCVRTFRASGEALLCGDVDGVICTPRLGRYLVEEATSMILEAWHLLLSRAATASVIFYLDHLTALDFIRASSTLPWVQCKFQPFEGVAPVVYGADTGITIAKMGALIFSCP